MIFRFPDVFLRSISNIQNSRNSSWNESSPFLLFIFFPFGMQHLPGNVLTTALSPVGSHDPTRRHLKRSRPPAFIPDVLDLDMVSTSVDDLGVILVLAIHVWVSRCVGYIYLIGAELDLAGLGWEAWFIHGPTCRWKICWWRSISISISIKSSATCPVETVGFCGCRFALFVL